MDSLYINWAAPCVVALTLAIGVAASGVSAPPSMIPTLEQCTFLELRMDGGWWIQFRKNEPADYGYGALPQRVSVTEETFSFEDIYREIIEVVVEPHGEARVTVAFRPMAPGHEGRVFAVNAADAAVSELFARAYRARDRSLEDGFQQQAIRALEPAWSRAPFLQ